MWLSCTFKSCANSIDGCCSSSCSSENRRDNQALGVAIALCKKFPMTSSAKGQARPNRSRIARIAQSDSRLGRRKTDDGGRKSDPREAESLSNRDSRLLPQKSFLFFCPPSSVIRLPSWI